MILENLNIYKLSMAVGEKIWSVVQTWNYFALKTIGIQLVKSADSISANISEGYGRFSYKENKMFCYYSRGSLFETSTWLKKAYDRNLISEEDYCKIYSDLRNLSVKLNNYINSLGQVSG